MKENIDDKEKEKWREIKRNELTEEENNKGENERNKDNEIKRKEEEWRNNEMTNCEMKIKMKESEVEKWMMN